jgi:hypothetical protein
MVNSDSIQSVANRRIGPRSHHIAFVLLASLSCAESGVVRDAAGNAGTGGATGASGSNGGAGTGGAAAIGDGGADTGSGHGGAGGGSGIGGSASGGRGGGAAAGAGGQAGANGGGGATGTAGSRGGTGGRGGAGGSAGAGNTGGGGAGNVGVVGPLAPAQGALLGAFVGTGTIAQLEATLGRKLAVSHNFYGWNDDYTSWVRSTLASGYIPLVTWEPWVGAAGVSIVDIANGAHDSLIRSRAQSLAGMGQKLFMRWGHEMNGNWYPWDGFHNGANASAGAKYIAAYRHIHDVFASAGASNVVWVFCPNVDSVPGDAWNQWSNYYPGDAYVDWMGFDGYNWGTVQAGSSWRSFAAITGTIYAGLAAKAKPIMIAETASTEQGGDKAAWIAGILPPLKESYPSIKALVWFHMNKETDWRVDSSTAARGAFMPMARDAYFNP